MSRKLLSIPAVAALLCLSAMSAHAEGGCGPGWHRAMNGRCYANGGPAVVVPGPVVVAPPVGVVCGPGTRWHPYRRRCWAY